MKNTPWRNHNPRLCRFRRVVAWKSIAGDRLCICFLGCSVLVWPAMWPCGLVGQVRLWGVGLNGIRDFLVAFSFSWCLAVRKRLLPLPTSHEERCSLFVSLLIKSEGSGKPLQLISTKKFAPKRKLSATYSRCKTYQILRIENKSVKLKGLCYVRIVCLSFIFNLLG